jgi:hypothetical protein
LPFGGGTSLGIGEGNGDGRGAIGVTARPGAVIGRGAGEMAARAGLFGFIARRFGLAALRVGFRTARRFADLRATSFFRRAGAARRFARFMTVFFALRFFAIAVLRSFRRQPPMRSFNGSGGGPPVAQSISSTVCTTGIAVPEAIWAMQPMLPAAITSGAVFSMLPILR